MLDPSKNLRTLAGAALLLAAGACAIAPEEPAPAPAAPVVVAPAQAPAVPKVDVAAQRMEEARALLAQAETDVQRARSRRALWTRAWEDLIAARNAASAKDPEAVSRYSRHASELARLGLEQLAYPAVK
jgi:hypothetical protein